MVPVKNQEESRSRKNRKTGNLIGEITDDGVRINLNPNMADNNVALSGKITAKVFRGDWSFSGFAGVINRARLQQQQNN